MPDVTILLVEDNPDDAALTELALRGGIPASLQVARDGQEALDYLFNHHNHLPRLVLLDLRLPNIDGLEVLRRIRENERTRLTPVVILTSSSAPDDVATGYRYGANSYVCKPLDFDQSSRLLRELGSSDARSSSAVVWAILRALRKRVEYLERTPVKVWWEDAVRWPDPHRIAEVVVLCAQHLRSGTAEELELHVGRRLGIALVFVYSGRVRRPATTDAPARFLPGPRCPAPARGLARGWPRVLRSHPLRLRSDGCCTIDAIPRSRHAGGDPPTTGPGSAERASSSSSMAPTGPVRSRCNQDAIGQLAPIMRVGEIRT